jgi:F-type H+-transporting ATPase subunit b
MKKSGSYIVIDIPTFVKFAAGFARVDFSLSICYIPSMLDLNSSLLWIFFMVWGLYVVLNRIFFKPVGKIIAEREAKIAVDANHLQGMLDQVEIHTQALETQMNQARKDALQIREEWSRKGEAVRAQVLADAKEKAARLMDEKMSALEKEVNAAEKTLEREIVVFSEKIRQAYL